MCLVKSQVVREQAVEEKVAEHAFDRRFCRVSFEDELAEHCIKHVGHAGNNGGKGEDFKTQDGRIGMELEAT